MADFAQQPAESDAEWLARLEKASRTELSGEERFAAFSHEQMARRRVDRGQREGQGCEQTEAEARDPAVANGTQETAELTLLEQAKEACPRLETEDPPAASLVIQAALGAHPQRSEVREEFPPGIP